MSTACLISSGGLSSGCESADGNMMLKSKCFNGRSAMMVSDAGTTHQRILLVGSLNERFVKHGDFAISQGNTDSSGAYNVGLKNANISSVNAYSPYKVGKKRCCWIRLPNSLSRFAAARVRRPYFALACVVA